MIRKFTQIASKPQIYLTKSSNPISSFNSISWIKKGGLTINNAFTLTKPYLMAYNFSQEDNPEEKYSKAQINAILRNLKGDSLDLDWKYVRGGGKGGQKVNKTTNCVILTHTPTKIQVKVHKSRELETNKQLALRNLKQKLDDFYNGNESKKAIKDQKRRKNKSRNKRRSKLKHQNNSDNSSSEN